ncbi:hypothetical protein [Pontibacillus salipaludis]|uniref:hypothetical protein n=1 Tax=Pontibacillus salipaludis TaxID=1697394 RepID=UPI0031E67B51
MSLFFYITIMTGLALIYYGYVKKLEADLKKKELDIEEKKLDLEIKREESRLIIEEQSDKGL